MVASDVAWTCCQECAAQGNWRQAGAEGRKTFRRNSARRQKIALWATFEENPKETSMKYVRIVVVAVAVAGLSACATNDPNPRAKTGAGLGAFAGGVLGTRSEERRGGKEE